MRKLGLDLGTKSLGVALSDEMSIIATAKENFRFELNDWESALNKIGEYLNNYKIDLIVLGYPLRMTGTKSERTFMVEDFKKMIEDRFDIKTVFEDERLTSKKANLIMRESNLGIKRRKEKKDMVSAVIILQSYLERL
ncbi:MAG: Holliday junction resolvase RuvX [Mycoplasma sp.]|nr:Holliday junction resolvase RuvX [Mycoplasma sp.]